MRHGALLVLVLVAAGGCGRGDDSGSGYTVRDSAGIRIVEYTATPPAASAVRFAGQPAYRYGAAEGDRTFQLIFAGALEPDGSAVVADAGTDEVMVLSTDGTLKTVLAKKGQGPEEVSGVRGVTVLGQDTIVVEDDGNGRFMEFESAQLTHSVRTGGDFSLTYGLRAVGADAEGHLLMITSAYRPGFKEPWFQGSLVRFDLSTGVPDTVGRYDMVPFVPTGEPANAFGAFSTLTATHGDFVYGRSDVARLTWTTSEGVVRQVVRWPALPVYPQDSDLQAFLENMRARLRRANPGVPQEQVDELMKRQAQRYRLVKDAPMPLFSELVGDGQGGVWVGEYVVHDTGDGPRRYDVVSSDGSWLGTATLPDRFRLLAVRGGRALGILRDDMDVETVAAFDFERR